MNTELVRQQIDRFGYPKLREALKLHKRGESLETCAQILCVPVSFATTAIEAAADIERRIKDQRDFENSLSDY